MFEIPDADSADSADSAGISTIGSTGISTRGSVDWICDSWVCFNILHKLSSEIQFCFIEVHKFTVELLHPSELNSTYFGSAQNLFILIGGLIFSWGKVAITSISGGFSINLSFSSANLFCCSSSVGVKYAGIPSPTLGGRYMYQNLIV